MADDNEKLYIIDFPQAVSVRHPNANIFFDRDVECIRIFFERKFEQVVDTLKLQDIKIGEKNLDFIAKASGYRGKVEKSDLSELLRSYNEENKNEIDEENDENEDNEEEEKEINIENKELIKSDDNIEDNESDSNNEIDEDSNEESNDEDNSIDSENENKMEIEEVKANPKKHKSLRKKKEEEGLNQEDFIKKALFKRKLSSMEKKGPFLPAKVIMSETKEKLNSIEFPSKFQLKDPFVKGIPFQDTTNILANTKFPISLNPTDFSELKLENESLFSQLRNRNEENIKLMDDLKELASIVEEERRLNQKNLEEIERLNQNQRMSIDKIKTLESSNESKYVERYKYDQLAQELQKQNDINKQTISIKNYLETENSESEKYKEEIDTLNDERIELRERIQDLELQVIERDREFKNIASRNMNSNQEYQRILKENEYLKNILKEQTEFFGKEIENFSNISGNNMTLDNKIILDLYKEISFLKLRIRQNQNTAESEKFIREAIQFIQCEDADSLAKGMSEILSKLNESNSLLDKLKIYKEESKRASDQMRSLIKKCLQDMNVKDVEKLENSHILNLVKELTTICFQKYKYSQRSEETLRKQDEKINSLEKEIESLMESLENSKTCYNKNDQTNKSRTIIQNDEIDEIIYNFNECQNSLQDYKSKFIKLESENRDLKKKTRDYDLIKDENKLLKGKFSQLIKISQSTNSEQMKQISLPKKPTYSQKPNSHYHQNSYNTPFQKPGEKIRETDFSQYDKGDVSIFK